jgi:hypothetical protein
MPGPGWLRIPVARLVMGLSGIRLAWHWSDAGYAGQGHAMRRVRQMAGPR